MDMAAETTTTAEEQTLDYSDYIEALEKEREKIQVFQRELPLSLHLITQAIESCRQRMGGCRSEIDDEEISCENGPILEEFMPIKRKGSSGEDQEDSFSSTKRRSLEFFEKKPDWLRSVQLWSPLPDEEDDGCRQAIVADRNKGSSAFHPFLPRKRSQSPSPAVAAPPKPAPAVSCTSDGRGGKGSGDDKDPHQHRKARRCWSPELHRRFLDALQQLGGSHVATPKQIRDLMKVEGLTNDEVKSHLQKYRLHSRRPSSGMSHGGGGSALPHQVVFLGGLWVPPAEYAAGLAQPPAAAERAGGPPIYAPVASLPLRNGEGEGRAKEGAAGSISPATSSSSRTTSASHFNHDNAVQSC